MGFSVSGATALLLVAFLISFGAFYTAATGTFDQIQDAQVDQVDQNIEAINTNIDIGSATYNESGNNELVIVANNTGASSVSLSDTDLLIDGEYTMDWQPTARIDGDADRGLWVPQSQLEITVDFDAEGDDPEQVRLVTIHGIAATESVMVVQ